MKGLTEPAHLELVHSEAGFPTTATAATAAAHSSGCMAPAPSGAGAQQEARVWRLRGGMRYRLEAQGEPRAQSPKVVQNGAVVCSRTRSVGRYRRRRVVVVAKLSQAVGLLALECPTAAGNGNG